MEHYHYLPTWPPTRSTHTAKKKRAMLVLPSSVIIIIPPRASGSNFSSCDPDDASLQTMVLFMMSQANNRPNTLRRDNPDFDEKHHKRNMLGLRQPGSYA